MQNRNTLETPFFLKLDLVTSTSNELIDATLFPPLIGVLLHMANTVQRDVSSAVGYLSRFMHRHSENLRRAGKHVLTYLCGMEEIRITYSTDDEGVVRGYSDADRESERSSSKSITRTVLFCCEGARYWRSKRQSIVAQSSQELEFVAPSF